MREHLQGIETAATPALAREKIAAFLALDLHQDASPMWMAGGYTITWGDLRLLVEEQPCSPATPAGDS